MHAIPSAPDPTQYRDVLQLLRANAERSPDRVFLHSIDQATSITFEEMYRLANRLSAVFAEMKIGVNDRVAVLAEGTLEKLILYYAILRHGATFCTINVEVNAAHLREMLARLEPKLVLRDESLDSGALGVGDPGDWRTIGEILEWADARSDGPERPCLAGPDDIAVISFTSGTSAAPKGVMHNFGNYFWIARQTIDMWKLTESDKLLEYRSFSWASSHMLTLMPCLVAGASIVFARHFSQSRFFDWIRDFRPTVVIGVPTVVNMLLNRETSGGGNLFDGVRFMSCSTAPLMLEQHQRFEKTYGIELVQLYGMSEGGVVAGNHAAERRMGTVGPPGLYQNLKIIGDEGRELPAGRIGEIEIGGAQNGYAYLLPDKSEELIRGKRLKTGDLGYLDADGFLHITGRAKDLIIRGGVNIAPLEIDNALTRHPDIVEAATIGVPDRVYGEEVVSYVAVRPGTAPSEAGVLAFCAEILPDFKRPKRIVLVSEIPKNQRGKIDRNALADAWTRERPVD
jgi:acyl-CoA synthetase (AMP-forming)/AMP-acid ligase II